MLSKLTNLAQRHRRRELLAAIGLLGLLVALRLRCWLTARSLTLVVLLEHVGDIIACEPVAVYLRAENPRALLVWVCDPKYADLVRYNPAVDVVASAPCLLSWARLRKLPLANQQVNLNLPGRACAECGRSVPDTRGAGAVTLQNFFNHGGLLTAFSLAAGLPPLTGSPQLHLPDAARRAAAGYGLPRPYVVIHCASVDSAKEWEPHKWRELTSRLREQVGHTVVEVGLTSVLRKAGARDFIDMCGATSLLVTAAVIEEARVFIGIDSGPAHMANALRCPGIILLGKYRHFETYLPYTGFYAEEGATIVRAPGAVSSITVDEVLAAVLGRLQPAGEFVSTTAAGAAFQ
jgi:ADP-heptose:LPS heptosyltransferase